MLQAMRSFTLQKHFRQVPSFWSWQHPRESSKILKAWGEQGATGKRSLTKEVIKLGNRYLLHGCMSSSLQAIFARQRTFTRFRYTYNEQACWIISDLCTSDTAECAKAD